MSGAIFRRVRSERGTGERVGDATGFGVCVLGAEESWMCAA